ncbi:hypothetical protein GCM10025867_49040 (plasmid) [Frondihabitans sucicola]|uniref:Uncharacterized protein n=1 Tax=Frondihabitans sucicola TaxID=1268041 RepID=A0ABM8GWA2_9MICO|nr:hypothetical protein [Frondihabitans sucicola]BDZ52663.1 hypothetical protein GCM10025867_49040 [Frondihabitans sucicola]
MTTHETEDPARGAIAPSISGPLMRQPADPDATLPEVPRGPRGITVRPVVEGSGRGHIAFRISGRALPATTRSFDGVTVINGHEGLDEQTIAWMLHVHARAARAINSLEPEARIAVNGDSAASQAVVLYAIHQTDLQEVARAVGTVGYGLIEVAAALQADLRRYLTSPIRALRTGGMSKQAWSVRRNDIVRATSPSEPMKIHGEARFGGIEYPTVRAVLVGSEPVRDGAEMNALRDSILERLDDARFAARRYRSPSGTR